MNESLPEAIKEIARNQRELRAMVADNVTTIPTILHTLSNEDHNKKLVFTSNSTCTVLVPDGLLPFLKVDVFQAGQGHVRVLEASESVMVENFNGHNQTAGRLAEMTIQAIGQDHFVTSGQMSTSAN